MFCKINFLNFLCGVQRLGLFKLSLFSVMIYDVKRNICICVFVCKGEDTLWNVSLKHYVKYVYHWKFPPGQFAPGEFPPGLGLRYGLGLG